MIQILFLTSKRFLMSTIAFSVWYGRLSEFGREFGVLTGTSHFEVDAMGQARFDFFEKLVLY